MIYNQILDQIKTTTYYHTFLQDILSSLFNFDNTLITKAVNTFLNLVVSETDNLANNNCLYSDSDNQKVMKNILTRQVIPFALLMSKFQNIAGDDLGTKTTKQEDNNATTKTGYAGYDITNQEGEFQTNTFNNNKNNSMSKTNTLETIKFINEIKNNIIPSVYNDICNDLVISMEAI